MKRSRGLWIIVAGLFVAAAATAADRSAGQTLSVLCVNCHGNDGYSARGERPNLAHQKEGYLALQLRRFRDVIRKRFGTSQPDGPQTGSRNHPVMNLQAGLLSDQEIQHLAAYYAGLSCKKPASPQPLPQPAAAEKCVECHGAGGVSASPDVPNLAGQNEDFLIIQLKAFRKSTIPLANAIVFPLRSHPEMGRLARHLTNANLRAIAAYFNRLPCS